MGNLTSKFTSKSEKSVSSDTNSKPITPHDCRLKIQPKYLFLIIEYFLRNCKLFDKSSKDVIQLISFFAFTSSIDENTELKTIKYDYLLKCLLIGDSGVGKSSFLLRYVDNSWTDSYISTIGIDFRISTRVYSNTVFKLQIWDTAGRERFRQITSAYYRGAHIIFVLYDITFRESFINVENWINEIERHRQKQSVKAIVFGAKSDLENERVITKLEAINKCKELNNKSDFTVSFGGEISSKMNYGFENMTQTILDIYTSKFDKCKYCIQILN